MNRTTIKIAINHHYYLRQSYSILLEWMSAQQQLYCSSILASVNRLKAGQKFFSIQISPQLACISMQLLNRHSPEVRIKMSMYSGTISLANTAYLSLIARVFPFYQSFSASVCDASKARSTALLYSWMLSQEKQRYIVICVLFFVLSWILRKPSLMSGKAAFSLPSRSPAIMTLTLFFSMMSKMLSCQQISERFWNYVRARFIRNQTSLGARLQFSIENAQNDATLTPNSKQYSRHFLRVSAPSWWPLKACECFCLANLRLPSMMKAMCRGTRPFFITAIANFSKVLS